MLMNKLIQIIFFREAYALLTPLTIYLYSLGP